MRIYEVSGVVEDDGKSFEAVAVIVAHDKKEATRLGREVLIGAYQDAARGYWLKPRVRTGMNVDYIPFPTYPMTLLATCDAVVW